MNYIAIEECYGAHNYLPLPVVLVKGQGVYVWDEDGKQYLDMMSAYSAISHGHCHPRLVQALTEQANRLAVVSRAFYSDKLGLFLRRACELTEQDKALPMNSGAEAVETSIKAARKWAYTVKGVQENQAEVIICEGNFHGRTTTIISMSSEPQYRFGFGPYTPGFIRIPYGDANALEKAISDNTAAFLVEPIQGESGIRIPPAGYLKKCEEICRQRNVLLICDEIQTGLGRTGKLLACEHEEVKPDGLILGKALGGGLLPVSLFLSKADVMDVFTPGDHGSTFGGNPLAAAVGLTALEVLLDEQLPQRAATLGEYMLQQLQMIQSPLIKEIRGRGLFIGIEIDKNHISAHSLCLKLMKLGMLTKETHETVIRLAPPLVITKEQIDTAVGMVRTVLELESIPKPANRIMI
ncbi:MAG: ornithine--oxo-acid transaminase [Gammaproteobacteria bacterium]